MKKLTPITLLALILACFTVQAQEDSTSSLRLKLSINANSRLHYYGRTDSLQSTGFFPMAELWFSPRFYINAAPVFVNNAVQRFEYAGTVVTAGYQSVTDKWITSLYVLKPFYTPETALVQSALKAQGGVTVSRLTRMINFTLGGDVKWSDRMDFGATAGLDHLVRIENKDKSVLLINPSVYAYAGTQHFSNSYFKKSGLPVLPGGSQGQTVTQQVQEFNILSYEASVPLIYLKNNWMVMVTPSYVLPQNLVTVAGRPDLSERGQKMFYVTGTIKYTF